MEAWLQGRKIPGLSAIQGPDSSAIYTGDDNEAFWSLKPPAALVLAGLFGCKVAGLSHLSQIKSGG